MVKGVGVDEVYNIFEEGVIKFVLGDIDGGVYGVIDFVGVEFFLNFVIGVICKGGYVVVVGFFGGGYVILIFMFLMW